jgi:hypothetical protein
MITLADMPISSEIISVSFISEMIVDMSERFPTL